MPIGFRNGTELAYDLHEVAKMFGHPAVGCTDGLAFVQRLGDYFCQHHLIVLHNASSGWSRVSRGGVRAYCIEHDLPFPSEVLGCETPEETGALVRKMQRLTEAAQGPVVPLRPAKRGSRARGGALPQTIFVEDYVKRELERLADRTVESLRNGLTPYILQRMGEDPECPFISFDSGTKQFKVLSADGMSTRLAAVSELRRSVAGAFKKFASVSNGGDP